MVRFERLVDIENVLSIFIMKTIQVGCLLTGIVAQRQYTRYNETDFILILSNKNDIEFR